MGENHLEFWSPRLSCPHYLLLTVSTCQVQRARLIIVPLREVLGMLGGLEGRVKTSSLIFAEMVLALSLSALCLYKYKAGEITVVTYAKVCWLIWSRRGESSSALMFTEASVCAASRLADRFAALVLSPTHAIVMSPRQMRQDRRTTNLGISALCSITGLSTIPATCWRCSVSQVVSFESMDFGSENRWHWVALA